MIFRQDFKKVYVRALFILGWWGVSLIHIFLILKRSADVAEIAFVVGMTLFFALWCISHIWYYIEVTDNHLVKHVVGRKTAILIRDIIELSYEDNPARPLVYITFATPEGGEDYIEFTTGVWTPHALALLNQELQRRNPNIKVRVDEKTQTNFKKDREYHLSHPKNVTGWILLAAKQALWGAAFGVLLILIATFL